MTPDGDAAPSRYDSASLRKINLNHKIKHDIGSSGAKRFYY